MPKPTVVLDEGVDSVQVHAPDGTQILISYMLDRTMVAIYEDPEQNPVVHYLRND